MSRILIIPHQPHRNLKVRAVEMGKALSAWGHEVFMLTWESHARPAASLPEKLLRKTLEAAKTAQTSCTITDESGLHWVRLPYLLAPWPWCQPFNRNQLERFIREQRIDTVISGNAYHFPMPETPGLRRIYDVVDDHLSENSGPHWRRTRSFTLNELKKADTVTVISYALQEKLAELGYPAAVRLPNGVDLPAFQGDQQAAVDAVRQRYQLDDCFTVGYIGNHGWWSGMDLLIRSFEKLQQELPQARLLIVGPGEDLNRYQAELSGNPNVIFTGPVPPAEISAYFQAIDLGVLPFDCCPFTDNALPLKILEYGAAQKQTLATPLKELQTLAFPHVRLLDPDPQVWADAMATQARHPDLWQPGWDRVIANYDWPLVLAPLRNLLETVHAPAV